MVRGHNVLLDLTHLYGVETKALTQADHDSGEIVVRDNDPLVSINSS